MHQHEQDTIAERDRLQHDLNASREGVLEHAHDYNQTRFDLDTFEHNIETLGAITDEKERAVLYQENERIVEFLIENSNQDSTQIRVLLDEIGNDVEQINGLDSEINKGDQCMDNTNREKDEFMKSVTDDKIKGYQIADLAKSGYSGEKVLHEGNDLRPLAREISDHGLRHESFNVDKNKQLPDIIKDINAQVKDRSIQMEHGMSR